MVSKYKMDSMDVTCLVSGKDMVDEELRDFTHIPCSDSIREKLKGYYFYSMIDLFMGRWCSGVRYRDYYRIC